MPYSGLLSSSDLLAAISDKLGRIKEKKNPKKGETFQNRSD